ncbi:hypothetical protein [Halococcus sp. IIIV-5B]|uniref:hypothetical protein n=1 Tax=Halococcus sp. IIIV-5B TaxID=2321230 RepID=UPI000E73C022|nr:hypothetical protein [Halococcus sp. IIIV-5B]RJT06784.1 hypothetical protein D3261_04545 [Halococcus sp. IIIV-5B]
MAQRTTFGADRHRSGFEFETRTQLDLLIFLVALVGAGLTLGPPIGLLVGLVCLGVALLTLARLYSREFR